jgi:hypothetical protein
METERNNLRKKQLSQAKDLEKLRKEINQLKKKNAKSVSLLYVLVIKFSRMNTDSQSMNLYKIITIDSRKWSTLIEGDKNEEGEITPRSFGIDFDPIRDNEECYDL